MKVKEVKCAIERLEDHMGQLVDYRVCDNDLKFHTTSSDLCLINEMIELYEEKNSVISKAVDLLEEVI